MTTRATSKKLYFAYGSCMDYQGRMTADGYADEFALLGIACLNGYVFRLNKLASDQFHVYANIQKQRDKSLYGYLYEISDTAEEYLDRREGYPNHYTKRNVTVDIDGTEYKKVIVYIAKSDRTCPVQLPIKAAYYHELVRGSERLPESYRAYLRNYLDKCYQDQLYHYHNNEKATSFMQSDAEFYTVIKEMALTLGNDNQTVEKMNITPEMFRIMVKLTEMAFRNELDLGHGIPRGLLKKLSDEFETRKNLVIA